MIDYSGSPMVLSVMMSSNCKDSHVRACMHHDGQYNSLFLYEVSAGRLRNSCEMKLPGKCAILLVSIYSSPFILFIFAMRPIRPYQSPSRFWNQVCKIISITVC